MPLVAFQDLDDLAAAGLTADDVIRASWWVPADGAPLSGADGIAAALHAGQPQWSRLAGMALRAPVVRSLARPAYRWVAANRDRLPAPDVDPPSRPD